jgi:phospholipase/carboxylesterase
MDLQTIVLEPARPRVASVIMLHGLGADGTDFLPLADELELGTWARCAGSFRARRCAR